MPAQVTTRAQVNGYRFLVRRLQHALIRADSRMIHDPMRGQMRALLTGVAAAILIAGAAGVLAFFKPAPSFGNSTIMLSDTDGALYVRIGDRLHLALNLASARLAAGKNETPGRVDRKFLDTVARGPAVGIIGAPSAIHAGEDMSTSAWTVCDSTVTPPATAAVGATSMQTTVLAGDPVLGPDVSPGSTGQAFLVRSGAGTYLLYDGVRAAIDPTDPVLIAALRLDGAQPRAISAGLLNAFPSVAPIRPIRIDGVGAATFYLPADFPVGSLVRTTDSRGDQLYVVLPEGLQPVSAETADIIRYGNPESAVAREPAVISLAGLGQLPVVHVLGVDDYPATALNLVSADSAPVVCMSWEHRVGQASVSTRVLLGNQLPLPRDAQPVQLAGSDGAGPGLDAVYLKPGTGAYVQAANPGPGPALGDLFYVSDLGLRYPVKDEATAAVLGLVGVRESRDLPEHAMPAPWPILSLLPAGPRLSQEAALIAHDAMAADPAGQPTAPQP
ncbi:type VII secretion protein EccB [Mycobacterium sp. 21AC1]|uniref:type VII secretion protein EccB n=1 Tax=[Mycobacterium] appelbergii TaxID=2939269 RepID=UPI002938DF2B|nr:type VII secretion protein EccB [Mycobacterium sp. 21AC1]MDV3128473.1 type VII secretion protein EccB [Mycobacterium sp. 21AC1]